MERKFVNLWKKKMAVRKAVDEYSGSGSRVMRTLMGNYPGTVSNYPWGPKGQRKTETRSQLATLIKWLRSKTVNTPKLYKGLSSKNANQFRKTGKFNTRTPTSTSKNRFQAEMFTNRNKNKVILVIPSGKRHAMILGQHGITARQPREQEVILSPGTFRKIGRNKKTGNYIVNYQETGRSIPRRRNFII